MASYTHISRDPDNAVGLRREFFHTQTPALFTGIQPNDYSAITSRGRVRTFGRGEMLHLKGESVQQVLLLTAGYAKVTQFGATGAEVILRLGVPGDVLGASGLFSAGLHCTTAQAFRPCKTLSWDARVFRILMETYPVVHQNMARILGEELMELEERFLEVATEKVSSRLARQLLRLQEKMGRVINGEVELQLSREELAQMTGTTLFTVSRILSAWETEGIVKPAREVVVIRDRESLRLISSEA